MFEMSEDCDAARSAVRARAISPKHAGGELKRIDDGLRQDPVASAPPTNAGFFCSPTPGRCCVI